MNNRIAMIGALLFLPNLALAHTQSGLIGGFTSGFMHPILGPDHLVAMVAVGLWGAQLGYPAIWVLPVTFPAVMAIGGLLGILAVPLPFIEFGIATSALILGAMVATNTRPPLWVAGAIVAVFAIFHGHAHGTELPEAVNTLGYAVGFVLATGMLHLSGILIGLLVRWPIGEQAVRLCGGLIAMLGGLFLASNLGLVT